MNIPSTMYSNYGQLLTKHTSFIENQRYASKPDESIEEGHIPSLDNYWQYLKENNSENSRFSDLLEEYVKDPLQSNNLTFISYIQYLKDENKLSGDRELYSHILNVLNFMEFENFIHPTGKKRLCEHLSKVFYSINAKYKKNDVLDLEYVKLDYSKFYDCNSKKCNTNQVINELYANGGELYINNKGKYCLKLSKYHEIVPYTKTAVENMLRRHFGFKIKITDTPINYKDIDINDFIFETKVIGVTDVK